MTPVSVSDIVQSKNVLDRGKVTVVPNNVEAFAKATIVLKDVACAGHKLLEADAEVFVVAVRAADLALELNLIAFRVGRLIGDQFCPHLVWLLVW